MKEIGVVCLLVLVFATSFLLLVGGNEEGFEECQAFCENGFYLDNDMAIVGECGCEGGLSRLG